MATLEVLQFRVHSVRCIRPTNHGLLEPDPDAIDLAAVMIDENGEAESSRMFFVRDRFSAGVQHDFSPPLVVYPFDLNEASFWPRTYFSMLTLAERDDWGRIDDWVVSAVRDVSAAVSSMLGRLTSRETAPRTLLRAGNEAELSPMRRGVDGSGRQIDLHWRPRAPFGSQWPRPQSGGHTSDRRSSRGNSVTHQGMRAHRRRTRAERLPALRGQRAFRGGRHVSTPSRMHWSGLQE